MAEIIEAARSAHISECLNTIDIRDIISYEIIYAAMSGCYAAHIDLDEYNVQEKEEIELLHELWLSGYSASIYHEGHRILMVDWCEEVDRLREKM